MKVLNKHHRGAATLILVLIMSVLLVFLIAGWQSRLLLSLHRAKAMSDILILSYHAESKIYDLLAKFLGGYPGAFSFPFSTTETLADGTVLDTEGYESGNFQTLQVGAKRLFGSSKIEIIREDLSSIDKFFQDTQIVMSLDCTGSMGNRACPTCLTTRMEEQTKAVLQFLDAVESTEGHERIQLGVSVFTMKADWLYTSYDGTGNPTGTAVRPDNPLSIDEIKQAVNNGFGITGEAGSPACKKLNTYTSIGSGLSFMHDYLRSVKESDTKQVEILITDGEPNQRIPYSSCPVDVFCPGDGRYCCPSGSNCYLTGWTCPVGQGPGVCTSYARDFLRCTLADTNQSWIQEAGAGAGASHMGVRDPDTNVYTVTVMQSPPAQVLNIFESFATEHYHLSNADKLTEILGLILQEILHSLTNYRIQRVVPTPIR